VTVSTCVICSSGLCAVAHSQIRTYHYVETPMTWNEAWQYCRTTYTDLADVNNAGMQEILLDLAGNNTEAWIGLYRDQQNWQWSSGEEVTSYNWKSTYFCAQVNDEGTWEDTLCMNLNYFMCSTETSQGSRTYTLIKQSQTWATARDQCRQQHADLVTISSPSENQAVKATAQGSNFWIGLFNDPWEWDDGGNSSLRLWNSIEPNNLNRNQLCVAMEPAQWRDYYCSEMYTFFCCDGVSFPLVFQSTLMSWSQAQSHCRSLNKDLVTIYSQQENQQLQKLPGYVSGLSWIGMYHGKENWQWVSGKRASYANWKTQLSCATIGPDGYWTDVSCHELHPFMCYS
uniref:C-type lectin domain-containing protein n=1 Tax=Lepisosteus oculatus TaxID=7918 RepID=W5M644_LEPOC